MSCTCGPNTLGGCTDPNCPVVGAGADLYAYMNEIYPPRSRWPEVFAWALVLTIVLTFVGMGVAMLTMDNVAGQIIGLYVIFGGICFFGAMVRNP